MILKNLKNNALKKSINTYIRNRKTSVKDIDGINSLAVLIDASTPVNILSLVKLADELGVSSNKLKVIGYKEDPKEIHENSDTAYYSYKSLGVNGTVKSQSLKDFVEKEYDILINFYSEEKPELNVVAAASRAKFKVGYAQIDHRINDLIIGAAPGNSDMFISELKKYLKILEII